MWGFRSLGKKVSGEGKSDNDDEVKGLAAIHENFAGNNDDFRLYSFVSKTDDSEKYCGNTELFMGVGYSKQN